MPNPFRVIADELPRFLNEPQAEGFKGVLSTILPEDVSDLGMMIAGGPFGKAIKLGGLALAGAAYAPEAEAAKFPWMTPERIAKLLDRSAYSMDGQKAKSALTRVNSDDFLNALTTSSGMKDKITQEAGRYDPYKQQRWLQDSFLIMKPGNKEVLDHESRHRVGALQRAVGHPVSLPMELRYGYDSKLDSKDWRKLSRKEVKGQQFADKRGLPIQLDDVTPLAYDTPGDELAKYATEVDVPLKNIGIMLKPEGPGFSQADIDAYTHGYIPYGKIPAPKEPFTHPRDALDPREYDALFREWMQLGPGREPWNDWARQFYPEGVK